jgi:hypothetical protein
MQQAQDVGVAGGGDTTTLALLLQQRPKRSSISTYVDRSLEFPFSTATFSFFRPIWMWFWILQARRRRRRRSALPLPLPLPPDGVCPATKIPKSPIFTDSCLFHC